MPEIAQEIRRFTRLAYLDAPTSLKQTQAKTRARESKLPKVSRKNFPSCETS